LADHYAVERELGAGGMATVYLAEDLKHHRKVAIKVLKPELTATLGPERFHREIQIAAQLHHPHILGLLDSGEAGGFVYYVMPYVEGVSLREKLVKAGELPIPEAVRILRDVVDALAHAHAKGVVHRDIKPENVMLSGRHAMVTDFGVAKAVSEATGAQNFTSVGVALGTPSYMAPEQAAADPHMDHRADIYAVGVLGYELVAGRPPFEGPSPQSVLAKHVTEPALPVTQHRATVPPGLAGLIMRCLEKKPADRFQSADDMLDQLETLATTPSGGTTPTGTQPVQAIAPSGGRGLRLVGMVAGIAVFGTLGYLGLRSPKNGGLATTAPADSVPSVGVLPFTELTPKPGQEYFADGLTEEVIGALSKVGGIRVPGRASSMHFKGSTTPIKAIAETLHVKAILSASIQRAGDRVRIRADLVNAADGFQLWSDAYEQKSEDLFAVYDQVARGIAGALQVKLSAAAAAPVATRSTVSAEAYNAYLLGRFHLNQRTARSVDSARIYFQRAIHADSAYALAWSGLADALGLATPANYALPGVPNDSAKVDSLLARALAAGRRAVVLDSMSAEAHTSLAYALQAAWRWDESGREFDRALALNGNYPPLRHFHALYLSSLGKMPEALDEERRAAEGDPLSWIYADWVGWFLDANGDHAGALRQMEQLTVQYPGVGRMHRDLGFLLMRGGNWERGAAETQRWQEIDGDSALGRRLGEGFAQPRLRAATVREFGKADSRGADLAMVLGDRALAEELVKKLPVRRGYWQANYSNVFVINPEIHAMPAFVAQLRKMGLQ
jgi:serine/threonine-protein kinase